MTDALLYGWAGPTRVVLADWDKKKWVKDIMATYPFLGDDDDLAFASNLALLNFAIEDTSQPGSVAPSVPASPAISTSILSAASSGTKRKRGQVTVEVPSRMSRSASAASEVAPSVASTTASGRPKRGLAKRAATPPSQPMDIDNGSTPKASAATKTASKAKGKGKGKAKAIDVDEEVAEPVATANEGAGESPPPMPLDDWYVLAKSGKASDEAVANAFHTIVQAEKNTHWRTSILSAPYGATIYGKFVREEDGSGAEMQVRFLSRSLLTGG